MTPGSARLGVSIRHCFSLCHSRAKRRIPESFLWPFLRVIQSRCGEESREFFAAQHSRPKVRKRESWLQAGRVELKPTAETRIRDSSLRRLRSRMTQGIGSPLTQEAGILRSADSALNDTKKDSGLNDTRTRVPL